MSSAQIRAKSLDGYLERFIGLKNDFFNLVLKHEIETSPALEKGLAAITVNDLSLAITEVFQHSFQTSKYLTDTYMDLYSLQQKVMALGMEAYASMRECYLLDNLHLDIVDCLASHLQASTKGMTQLAQQNPEGKAEFERTAEWGKTLLDKVNLQLTNKIKEAKHAHVMDSFFYFMPPGSTEPSVANQAENSLNRKQKVKP